MALIDKNQLILEQVETQKEMSQLLIDIREANGIDSPFTVSRELGQSQATLRNIEKGLSFPTKKTLNELIEFYRVTPNEKKKLNELKNKMLTIRKQLKESEGR